MSQNEDAKGYGQNLLVLSSGGEWRGEEEKRSREAGVGISTVSILPSPIPVSHHCQSIMNKIMCIILLFVFIYVYPISYTVPLVPDLYLLSPLSLPLYVSPHCCKSFSQLGKKL